MAKMEQLDVNYKWFGLLLATGFTMAPGLLFLFIAHMSKLDNDAFYEAKANYTQNGRLHVARVVEQRVDEPYVVFTMELEDDREVTHRIWGRDVQRARVSDTLRVWEHEGSYFAEIELPPANKTLIQVLYPAGAALMAIGIPMAVLFVREHWTRGPGKDMDPHKTVRW